ncbi:YebC/PmpR family DNA-binding transcriptional regulator [Anaerosphaera multitolerans]|uniref:Probable transcriptional regulatory protein EF514_04710 n=1 Tax=Anaerosphaera multitolerans TaxID=2487351 RepID=A0A437S762_9FIRM|nr:YebC/PmpR family DNA-binding transcriptional regulator [Anaerosphaera multitolerans]RVU54890.1 YebC/PmpR family DNA-binding transcriptional regulator [Anaerosphaera multitolerans]
MAGHSKWNNIKNKKGKEDAKRGRIFTKLGRYIMVAAKEGGPDPEYNPALKVAIDKAKAENMPNDNIERAIKKGSGEGAEDNFEEIIYEGYGPNGIAVMVHCLTDNRNRTASEIRHAFDKYGGNLGQSGSVSFMFDRKGQIVIEKVEGIDDEELMMSALDLGAEDVIETDDFLEILTNQENYHVLRNGLEELGYEFIKSDISYIPQNYTKLESEEDIIKMEKMIDVLEDNDDVQEVYTNWEESGEDE